MTKFIFDLDGTITKEETLPLIARHFKVEKEIEELTRATVAGEVPFVESFIQRVGILGKLPVSKIKQLLSQVDVYDDLVSFIQSNVDMCSIATGNLNCWIEELVKKIGCECFCSLGETKNDQVVRIVEILKKEELVQRYKAEGHRGVFVGDGNNDVEAMRLADVAIVSGLTHSPAPAAVDVADYVVFEEKERRGSGFKKILEDYNFQENSREELMPKFIADNSGFVLILYNLNYGVPRDVAQDVAQGRYTDVIIKMIREDNKITRANIAEKLGVSKKTIEREIKKISQLSYVGRGYSGHWEIKDK